MATILTDTLKKYAAIAAIGVVTFFAFTHGGYRKMQRQLFAL